MGLDNLTDAIDFVLAFAVVHEFPRPADFFRQASRAMRPGARMLLAEPLSHVSPQDFEEELSAARSAGLAELPEAPSLRRNRMALLEKAAQ
jgi:SAM-dependent methyltransferase